MTQCIPRLEESARSFEEFNDVLRRLLGLDDGKSVPTTAPLAPSDYISSSLMPLIADGLIVPGDALQYVSAIDETYHGVVEADGWITTSLRRYRSPSAALTALVGSSISGWGNWTHVRSGKTLRQLRDRDSV